MLAGALRSLIEAPGGVRMVDWYSEDLDSIIRHADVVVVDMPPTLHERTFAVLDGRFLGRTVVLLQEGERAEALPPGPPRAVLYRPLQIGELWSAVSGATEPPVTEEPTGPEGEAAAPASPEPEPSRSPSRSSNRGRCRALGPSPSRSRALGRSSSRGRRRPRATSRRSVRWRSRPMRRRPWRWKARACRCPSRAGSSG